MSSEKTHLHFRPAIIKSIHRQGQVLSGKEQPMTGVSLNPTTHETSRVFVRPAADPDDAHAFFSRKLSYETDPSDVHTDLANGVRGFIVLDVRSSDAHAQSHVPGAHSLPHATIDATTTAFLNRETLLVVYCWGPGCNAATKAAVKLSALGFRVKEMIGGIEYWAEKEGYPVERGG
jgi:rhodanese-related sulfurtransferase